MPRPAPVPSSLPRSAAAEQHVLIGPHASSQLLMDFPAEELYVKTPCNDTRSASTLICFTSQHSGGLGTRLRDHRSSVVTTSNRKRLKRQFFFHIASTSRIASFGCDRFLRFLSHHLPHLASSSFQTFSMGSTPDGWSHSLVPNHITGWYSNVIIFSEG